MDYIEKLDIQTEDVKEVENLKKHTIINNNPFTVDEYEGHDREFLAIDGEYDDGFNKLNEAISFGVNCKVSRRVNSIVPKIQDRLNAKALGVLFDENITTEKLQEVFNLEKPLYFPSGKIKIDKPILLPENVDVLCECDTEFLFDENVCMNSDYNGSGKLAMFKSNGTNKNFKWVGGIINGQGSLHLDNTKPNYWDSTDKDGNTAWGHDYQRAFLIIGYENVLLKDIKILDIFGHAIGHFCNTYFTVDGLTILQEEDTVTHPNGGSRRDGISGGSQHIVIRNLTACTDDDYIAIVNNLNWGYGQCKVNSVLIDGCRIIPNKTLGSLRAFAFYGDDVSKTGSVIINNMNGTIIKHLAKFTGAKIGECIFNNININCTNTNVGKDGQISLLGEIDTFELNNVNYTTVCEYSTSFIGLGLKKSTTATIKNLLLNVSYIQGETRTTEPSYGSDSFLHFYEHSYFENISGTVFIKRNNQGDYYFIKGVNGSNDMSATNTNINITFLGNNINKIVPNCGNKVPKNILINSNLALSPDVKTEGSFSFSTSYIPTGYSMYTNNGVNHLAICLYGDVTKNTMIKVASINPNLAPPQKIFFKPIFDKASANNGTNGWSYNFSGVGYIDSYGSIYVRTAEENCNYIFIQITF